MNIKLDFSNKDIDKSIPMISISTILSQIVTPKDRDAMVENTYNKHYNNPESEYYHMSKEQILERWDNKARTSMHYGSLLDDYIGNVLTGDDISMQLYKLDNNFDDDARLQELTKSFDNFYSILQKSGDTEFIDREQTVYYPVEIVNPLTHEKEQYYVKGRFDALFYNKRTKNLIIIDWKSSGSIDKTASRWTKKLLGPMQDFFELNWVTYTTQLYFYKRALIERYIPKDLEVNDVIVMIVNLPGKTIEETKTNFAVHNPAYQYDPELLHKTFVYGIQKYILQREVDKKKEEEKENITQANNNTPDLTTLF